MKQGSGTNRRKKQSYSRPTPEQLVVDSVSYQYTKGGEFTTTDGFEYIGEYHFRRDGKAYGGPVPTTGDNVIQLLPFYAFDNNFVYDKIRGFDYPIKDHSDPIPYEYVVREESGVYNQGYDTRYFVQKTGTGTYAIEIDAQQRDKYGTRLGIDSGIYKLVDLQWQLVGTLEAIEKINKERVNIASQMIPDIGFAIRNYTQYARPTSQTQFSSLDSQLARDRKFINGSKPSFRQTYDRTTGRIIPPQRLPNR
jgi:hypothetical protein